MRKHVLCSLLCALLALCLLPLTASAAGEKIAIDSNHYRVRVTDVWGPYEYSKYPLKNLTDGITGADGNNWQYTCTGGVQPFFYFDLSGASFSQIRVYNGGNGSGYKRNGRVREMQVDVRYSGLGTFHTVAQFTLPDTSAGWYTYDLGFSVEDADCALFTVKSYYKGTQWPDDVLIQELWLTGVGQGNSSGGSSHSGGSHSGGSLSGGVTAYSNQRIASRSGPGTTYTETGSYFQAGARVEVCSAAYDSRNGIWWVEIEVNYSGNLRRVYTGLKRIDVDINKVPHESANGSYVELKKTMTPYWGPGSNYDMRSFTMYAGEGGTLILKENGYGLVEFTQNNGKLERVWLPMNQLYVY